MPDSVAVILLLVVAYCLGSIPTSVWLSRWIYGTDIRTLGSGNAGSTNMYRSFGFKAGFVTQISDISKGSLATSLPWFLLPQSPTSLKLQLIMLSCGLLAVIGHTFPVFAGFRGGKGVNTILGMMIVLHPSGTLSSLLVFVIVLLLSRMVSLASVTAVYSFLIFSLIAWWVQQPTGEALHAALLFIGLSLALAVYITWTHRSNISRIRSGTERKVNF